MSARKADGPAGERQSEHRLIVGGFGGQGILTAGKMLCTAAMSEGKNVTYLPSYGAEVRGGTANCQLVVSAGTIYSPLVETADSLLIMNQLSYERFAPRIKPGGLLMLNGSLISTEGGPDGAPARALSLAVTDLAAELGDVRVANVILLGAFVRLTGIVAENSCLASLKELLGKRKAGLVELNIRAFREGIRLAEGTALVPWPS